MVEGSHECSKARVERGLFGALNVVAALLQNADCKDQIDIIDMVRSNLVFPLLGTSGDSDLKS